MTLSIVGRSSVRVGIDPMVKKFQASLRSFANFVICVVVVIAQVDLDYTEYFYHELKHMVHYAPASLENVTQVAEYSTRRTRRV
mmetsp:Transcript_15018/g.32785  ORF Transcript_15018/g.32785 Transcript_15018/m.32785 type:complete len:84 (-) Transcript_15018:287-538(-)